MNISFEFAIVVSQLLGVSGCLTEIDSTYRRGWLYILGIHKDWTLKGPFYYYSFDFTGFHVKYI